MYIDIVPNRSSPPAILLRESFREGKKILKRTLANLSALSLAQAEAIRAVLKGQPLAPIDAVFEVVRSRAHGAVEAIALAMGRLRLAALLGRESCRERDLVLAMIAARVLDPQSKLATARSWDHSTLGERFGVGETDENALYAALDWLRERQPAIEQRLAKRHLQEGARVLYDLSSSYFEGESCPLGARGYSRDGKQGLLQVNYGLLTDARGCPVSITAFPGNTTDPETLMEQVEKLQQDFALQSVVLVGDRGMISQTQIDALRAHPGIAWITALKSGAIRQLAADGAIQMDLFDERNLFECTHDDFPGERLIACRNPQLAKLRAAKRDALLAATVAELETVQRMVATGRLKEPDKIGVRVGRVINKYKMAKHVVLDIDADRFAFRIDAERVAAEAALDGIYVIRTDTAGRAGRQRGGGSPLQGIKPCRVGVPLLEKRRSADSSDLSPYRRAGARPSVSVHARLLRQMAHGRGLAQSVVRRRRPRATGPARSRGARDPLRCGLEKVATKLLPDGSPATVSAPFLTSSRASCAIPADASTPAPTTNRSISIRPPTPSSRPHSI